MAEITVWNILYYSTDDVKRQIILKRQKIKIRCIYICKVLQMLFQKLES